MHKNGCLRVLAWWEGLARVTWYYLSASVFFLCSLVLTGVDRNTHSFTAMHVNLHVLFGESTSCWSAFSSRPACTRICTSQSQRGVRGGMVFKTSPACNTHKNYGSD